jgi:hypothetical protein
MVGAGVFSNGISVGVLSSLYSEVISCHMIDECN